jgi:hypothetical protein
MYSIQQSMDPVIGKRIEQDRRESTPTPVWHLAKSANIDEKSMLYHLGKAGIEAHRWGADMLWHVSKADVRKLLGIEGQ